LKKSADLALHRQKMCSPLLPFPKSLLLNTIEHGARCIPAFKLEAMLRVQEVIYSMISVNRGKANESRNVRSGMQGMMTCLTESDPWKRRVRYCNEAPCSEKMKTKNQCTEMTLLQQAVEPAPKRAAVALRSRRPGTSAARSGRRHPCRP
jgi:hypothetical protein